MCVFSGRLVARCNKAGLAFGGGFCGAKLCRTDLRQRGQLLVRLGCLQLCILYTVCSHAMATTLLQVCATLVVHAGVTVCHNFFQALFKL